MAISRSANLGLGEDTLTATASTRFNLGIHHLFSACRATKRIAAVEAEKSGEPFGEFLDTVLHDGLVVATSSVACLECYPNELYFDPSYVGHGLSAAASERFAALVDRETVLEKFSIAQIFQSGCALPKGDPVVHDVDSLIRVRNALIHYRSEWAGQPREHAKLSARLAGKFSPSPFFTSEPVFPRAWASRSFAEWEIRSVYVFLVSFYDSAHAPSKLSDYKSTLVELSGCEL